MSTVPRKRKKGNSPDPQCSGQEQRNSRDKNGLKT